MIKVTDIHKRFGDLEVVALSLTAEHLSIDSENNLFDRLKEYKTEMPNLISRRQFNDRQNSQRNYARRFVSALHQRWMAQKNISALIPNR